jgi:hypothetical protein
MLNRPPLTSEQINANRARVGMPAMPIDSDTRTPKQRGHDEPRDAEERLLSLRDEAQRDPEAQFLVSARLVDRDWEGRFRIVSDHDGPAWDVWWMVASDVMDYFGLHGPFLDSEQTPDMYSAYNQCESVIEARGGRVHFKRLKRTRRTARAKK